MGLTLALLTLGFTYAAQITIYVDSRTPPPGDPNSGFYPDLLSSLAISEPDLAVFIQSSPPQHYPLRSFGPHLSLLLSCQLNILDLQAALFVPHNMTLTLDSCGLHPAVAWGSAPFITVDGVMVLNQSYASQFPYNLISVNGTFTAENCDFVSNKQTLVLMSSRGWTVSIRNCRFTRNTSFIGTIFSILISTPVARSSSLTVQSSVFEANNGLLGGTVGLIMEHAVSNLTTVSVLFDSCSFDSNQGQAMFIMYQSRLSFTIRNSTFINHSHILYFNSKGGITTLEGLTVDICDSMALSLSFSGIFSATNCSIRHVQQYSAIVLVNYGSPYVPVTLKNLTIADSYAADKRLRTPTLFLANVHAKIDRIRVSNCSGNGGFGGFYIGSLLLIQDVQVTGSRAEMAALMIVGGCFGFISDISISDSTVESTAVLGIIVSDVTFTGVSIRRVNNTGVMMQKQAMTLVAAQDSRAIIADFTAELPAGKSTPILLSVGSDITLVNTTFPALSGAVLLCMQSCTALVSNVTLTTVLTNVPLFDVQANSRLTIMDLHIGSGNEALQVIRTGKSSVLIRRQRLVGVRLDSWVDCIQSKVRVEGAEVKASRGTVLFSLYAACDLVLSESLIEGFTGQLSYSQSSKLTLNNTTLRRISPYPALFELTKSTFHLQNSVVTDFISSAESFFLLAKSNTAVFLSFATFHDFAVHNHSFLALSACDIHVNWTDISDFSGLFLAADHTNVHFTDSHVSSEVRNSTNSFLNCANCHKLTIVRSVFRNLTSLSGGAVAFQGLNQSSTVRILDSAFVECSARVEGGAIEVLSANLEVFRTNFTENRAMRGGAIAYNCPNRRFCSANISNVDFLRNSALEGGAIAWKGASPVLSNTSNTDNWANYGSFQASEVQFLQLNASQDSIVTPPGRLLPPLLVLLYDSLGQLVTTDNSTTVTLRLLPESSAALYGTTAVTALQGTVLFDSLLVKAPASNLTFEFAAFPANSMRFSVIIRPCISGEIEKNESCYECPPGSYSFNTSDFDCKQCVSDAICPGGANLWASSGHWLNSPTTDIVEKCPEESLCLGEELGQCFEGQTGRLCMQCREQFFSFGFSFCYECFPAWGSGLIVLLAVCICGIGVLWLTSLAVTHRDSVRLLSARIAVGHCHWILCVSCISVGWKSELALFFAANETVLSFGLSVLPGRCFLGDFSWVYLRAIVACLLPFFTLAVASAVFLLFHLLKKRPMALSDLRTSSILFLFLLYPYLTKSISALLRCKGMENASYWLYEDMGEQCWTGTHATMLLALFLPAVLVYFVAVPCFMLYEISKIADNSRLASQLYWDFAQFAVKTGLILVLSSLSVLESKLQVLFCVLTLYIPLYPSYSQSIHRNLAVLSQGSGLILALSSFFFLTSAGVSTQGRSRLGLVLVCFEAVVLAALVYCVLRRSREVEEVGPLPLDYVDGGEGVVRVPGNSMSEEGWEKGPDSPSFCRAIPS